MINTPDRQNNRKIVAMDDTLADPLTGRLLDGRYAVTARIAHGGMATVYRATDTRLDREVALKVMHAELARDEEFVRRFIGEAKSVARLSQQNVVAVYDQGADGPFLYLTMEYVPGRTLKQLLRDSGRFSPATAMEIMAGVLGGLAAAHASGIVHRDVKPENVLVTADGRVKVTDFGLARALSVAGHTRAGLLIGTVAYVPPEQVTGGTTGPRGDVYSAGVMLFELLTGRLPFTGDTPLSIAYQHVNADVPAPSALAPDIPAPVDQLVLAATSRDPARRPADAGEFLRAVRHVREGLPEPSGLTGVMGAGVQGLGEAPWLDLETPAETNGWWARSATQPPVPTRSTLNAHSRGGRGLAHARRGPRGRRLRRSGPPPGRPRAVPRPLAVRPAAAHRGAGRRARPRARARRLVAVLRPVRARALGGPGQRRPGHRDLDRRRLPRPAGCPGAQQHDPQGQGGRHQPSRAGVQGRHDLFADLERALHLGGARRAQRHAELPRRPR